MVLSAATIRPSLAHVPAALHAQAATPTIRDRVTNDADGRGANTVDGRSYPMEERFVNISASGATTVVAVFLRLGDHNAALDPILAAAATSLTRPNTATTIAAPIDLAGLLPTSRLGWFYESSLTTPPLSRVVNWLVLATPITLDAAQLQTYEAVAAGSGFLPNNRPVQPTDGRIVNRHDFDGNLRGQAVSGLDFAVARATASVSTAAKSAGSRVHAEASPAALSTTAATRAAVAMRLQQPVAGCNCPLCQMLGSAICRQVDVAALPRLALPSAVVGSPA